VAAQPNKNACAVFDGSRVGKRALRAVRSIPNPGFQGVPAMNEEALNMSLRKFLKVVGVTSQQEIEKAIRAAVADGRLKGTEIIDAQMTLTIGKINLTHKVDGKIELA
jgi:hypothetical protein